MERKNTHLNQVIIDKQSDFSMYEILPNGILIYSIEKGCAHLLYANCAALKIFECKDVAEMREICHDNYLNFFHKEDYRHHIPTIRIAWENEKQFHHHVQYRVITKNNEIRFVNDHGRVVNIPGYQKCYVCVLTPLDRQITYSVDVSDRLTGLLGMGQFIQYSENFLKTKDSQGDTVKYHIAYLNIRHFKNYNVEYGSEKGDVVLKNFASIISKWSTTKVVTRINGDQFVAISKSEEMNERIHHVVDEFMIQYGSYGLSLDVGVYQIQDYGQDIHMACDMAKIACDSIHNRMENICIYSENLDRELRLNNYVSNHMEQALRDEWLKIEYQPVVRTLTSALCGIEAYVRWEDPEMRIIPYEDYMPILEENKQSVKFDLWTLEQVCRVLKNRENSGKKMFPIAVLFSHCDFLNDSFFEHFEQIVAKYSIPRDMIILEIKETLVLGDDAILRKLLNRFRNSGYQVWLDDFGKNYSTLNHLNVFGVDGIKIDMSMLSFENEQTKKILCSTIQLAKRLGIQTVAKNVDEEEVYLYLKEIGCEKVQGNYFHGKSELKNLIDYAQKHSIAVEYRADRFYYDQISKLDVVTEHPVAIVEYDQKNFKTLYLNQAFLREGDDFGMGRDDFVDYMVNDPSSTLSRKFRYLQEHTKLGMEYAEMDFSVYGKYFRLKSRRISENYPLTANQVEIINLSKDNEFDKSKQLDYIFRMMYSMYDIIFILREDGRFENIMRSSSMEQVTDRDKMEENDILISKEKVIEHIYPDDREEFEAFVEDIASIKERLKQTERGYEIKYYRSKVSKTQGNGYAWKAHTLQYLPEMDIVLYSTRPVPFEQEGLIEKIAPEYLAVSQSSVEYILGKGLKESSCVGLFWKDTNRKFLGANKRYMEMFEIQRESELIGKYVEEFNWYVNTFNIRDDEEQVLKNGIGLRNIIEKCIVHGETHTVLVSKEPIYKNGEIVGLVGSIADIDDFVQEKLSHDNVKDEVTGLLSPNGMLNLVSGYVEGWNNRKEDFAVLRIEFLEQKQNYEEYGLKGSNVIAKKVADTLKNICTNKAVIARLYAGNYGILFRCDDVNVVKQLIVEIQNEFKMLHKVEGYNVSFYPKFKIYMASETESISHLIAVATGGSEDDLVARKHLEDKLNYYNLQLETVVDAIPGGIAMYEIVGEDIQMVYASSGVGAVTGKTSEEFREDSIKDHKIGVYEKDLPLLHEATMQAVQENKELNVSYRLKHKNGTLIWVNMRGRVIGAQNGHPLLLVVFRNLSEMSVIYESILDEALAGVFVSAISNGEILYANKSAKRTSEGITNGTVESLYHRIKSCCTPQKLVKSTGTSENHKEKYEIEMEGRNLLVFFVDGNWNGRQANICYVLDITAKYIEEREKVTRESLLYLQAINASYDMLVTFNLTKNQYSMRQGRNFLGYDWSNFRNYTELVTEVKKLVPTEDKDMIGYLTPDKQITAYRNGISYVDNEHRILDSKGKMHWVADRVVYARDPANQDIIGILLSMLIDERVKNRNEQKETLQKALDDAVEANKAKSQFLSNMSHDIRTPMNAVMGYTAIALQHQEDAARVSECLEKILASGNQLKELINDILDVSRIEAGKEELNITEASWDDFKSDMDTIFVPLARDKEIDLKVSLAGVTHRNVRADVSKMRRIIVNVIGNAIKFTQRQGEIRCQISEEETNKNGYGTYILQIQDNGIGMSHECKEHIFETFTREKTSTESQVAGTGLGMAITHKYVEMMGGHIEVQSIKGKGTTVIIELELEYTLSENPEVTDLEIPSEIELAGKCVLVVDDSDLNRDVVSMMLEDYGIQTEVAENGKDAVELLEKVPEGRYDCVLMDMRMPVMDGVTATRKIRASEREYLKRVPIIALSANAFEEDVKLCRDAGMNDHISKPFTIEKLIEKLKKFDSAEITGNGI